MAAKKFPNEVPQNGLSLKTKAPEKSLLDKVIAKFRRNPDSLSDIEIDMLPVHVLVPSVGYTYIAGSDGRLQNIHAQ